jgi:hypothetical protein
METPILLLIFNRPDTTRQVFDSIRALRPTKLFIAADGPRPDKTGEALLCTETIKIVEPIDWECEVRTRFRDRNLGCKIAVSDAITWFFEHVEEGIILEDDCLPHPGFFTYCSELLERYRTDTQVNFISGTCLPNSASHIRESYYFSKFSIIWGWATWKRVWQQYDVAIKDWQGLRNTDWLGNVFYGNNYFANGFKGLFDSIDNGYDTWDFQLFFLNLKSNSFNIHPAKNLISNIGFDERGTHTRGEKPYSRMPTEDIGRLIHPRVKSFDYKADEIIFEHLYKYDPRPKTPLGILYQKIRFKVNELLGS